MASAGFLAAVIRRGGTGTPTGVSDGRNGSWIKALEQSGASSDHTISIWYKENGGSGSAVTVTQTGGSGTNRWVIGEWTGVALASALDKIASQTHDSTITNFDSGATATTSQADELLIGGHAVFGSRSFSPTNSFIEVAEISQKVQMQYKIVSATGAYNSTCDVTASADTGCSGIATFKAASGGGAAEPIYKKSNPWGNGRKVRRTYPRSRIQMVTLEEILYYNSKKAA